MLNAFGVGVCKGVLAEGTVLPACKVVDAAVPGGALRQHQLPDPDDRRQDSRCDACCGVIRIFRRCRRLGDGPYSLATDGQSIYAR